MSHGLPLPETRIGNRQLKGGGMQQQGWQLFQPLGIVQYYACCWGFAGFGVGCGRMFSRFFDMLVCVHGAVLAGDYSDGLCLIGVLSAQRAAETVLVFQSSWPRFWLGLS